MLISSLLILAVCIVKDISVRIHFVLSSCLVLVLVFPVCINQNLLFSFVFLAACIVKDIVFRILLSRLVTFYVLVFPVCINQNQHFSLSLVPCIVIFCSYFFRSFFMSRFGFGISGLYKSESTFFFVFGSYRERYCFSYSLISSCFALRFALKCGLRVSLPRATPCCVQDVDFFTPDFGSCISISFEIRWFLHS